MNSFSCILWETLHILKIIYAVYQKEKKYKNYNNKTISYNQPQDLFD